MKAGFVQGHWLVNIAFLGFNNKFRCQQMLLLSKACVYICGFISDFKNISMLEKKRFPGCQGNGHAHLCITLLNFF